MVVGEGRTLFEPEELDHFSWNLDECDPGLSRGEFADDVRVGTAATIDLAGEAIVSASAGEVRLRQLELIGEGDDWTDRVQPERERGDDSEVPATAAQCPEQVGLTVR